MQVNRLGFRCLFHYICIFALLLFVGLSNTKVQAQKTPLIFKSKAGDSQKSTSATNIEYINKLEASYTTNEPQNNEEAKLTRNKLIFITVEQVDTVFNDYRRKSRKRNDLLQFLFDFLEIGASTAISITKGERPQALIAEGLSAFQGSRSAFNKDFRFLERQILFNKMVEKRSEKLSAVYTKLNDDVFQYPWEKARSELKEYFFAGTMDEALNSLSIDTGSSAKTQEENLAKIKKEAGIVSAPTQVQYKFSRINSDKIEAILAEYTNPDEKIANSEKQTADANKVIEEENKKENPDKKKIDDAKAVITKETVAKDSALKTKETALKNVKAIFKLIKDDSALSPLLDRIPEKYGKDNPQRKALLQASLSQLKEEKGEFVDYQRILMNFIGVVNEAIRKDSTLIERVEGILATNK